MSGKPNKYPLDNRAGVVCNRNRQEYALQMNNQHAAVSDTDNAYRHSGMSDFSCRAQTRSLGPNIIS